MNLAEITHRAYFLDCYPLDERHLKISIQTGKDVDEVILWAGDPYSAGIAENEQNWQGERVPMELERELAHRNVYSAVLTPAYRRVKYHFEITGGGESVCLYEDGFVKAAERFPADRMIQRFIYPWMNRADIMKVPEWAENIVWYQIFPDRFCRKNPGEKRHSCREWACQEDPTWKEFYGGDLAGIRSRLAYIADLGVGGIYLNPILWSDSNHRYDTIDYHSVEPDLGTEEELKTLIAEAHALGLRVMIDAVFNHCGAKCALWQDVLEKGPQSSYYHWFCVNRWPIDAQTHATKQGDYFSFAFVDNMPKFDTSEPDVMEYLTGIAKHWVCDWKVDGIRFDVGNEISHAFLKHLRLEVKKCNPKLFLLGEIWHDAFPWLLGDEYDSTMNYPFLACVNNFWADKTQSGTDFMHGINQCYSMYYEQVNRVLFNLLDSHDMDRLMERCYGNEDTFLAQLTVLFTMQGAPGIYYGTEIGMDGGGTKANRKCMPWEEIDAGSFAELTGQVKQLIAMRRQYPQTRSGKVVWDVREDSRLLHYYKKKEGQKTLEVCINAGEEPVRTGERGLPEPEDCLFANGLEHGSLRPQGVFIRLV
ncbi:glycoside hydrolase family 13 protein [Roseburia hominis]|uniref:glycoside hydrolase family 13 protein n=1 Tax=Roseburia hominis TaxID=301301 RepID=UPI003AF5B275